MTLFDKNLDIKIVLDTNAEEAIYLAARDLQRDLRRLSGHTDGFSIVTESVFGSAIRIQTTAAGEAESYTVCVDSQQVYITGADTLGTVFGIYAFERRCLDILPICRLTDLFPEEKECQHLPAQSFSSAPRSVRFRGWFLNDEDLLSDLQPGGMRHIDYPYYQNVIGSDELDMVLETALRLEMNLIIPSSFVNIDNPDEEELVQAVVRRGMYISQHHVEPLGVSYFAADSYLKRYGVGGEAVSFLTNRDRMEEIWRYYAGKWAKYGSRVIWQLGLRGKADKAVWSTDPSIPMDEKCRGAIIADAMATQHRIVRDVLGTEEFHSTTTLWLEGAALYGKGYLKIPEGTVVVFSDIGASQLFGDDFYRVQRENGRHYGVYYHVGYWGDGPHLAEGCDLQKMVFSYREAWEKNSLYYSILNVSNVRPLHFSAWFHAELLQNPAGARTENIIQKLLHAVFGAAAEAVAPLMESYYDAIADVGKAQMQDFCAKRGFYYHDYGKLSFPEYPVTDGVLRRAGQKMLTEKPYCNDDPHFLAMLEKSLPEWETLHGRMLLCEKDLPETCRLYFAQFLEFETFYMMQMTRWVLACREMVQSCSVQAYTEATIALTRILEKRKILEQGEWKNWHRGDKKIGVPHLLRQTEDTYRKLVDM